jgi:hypothetical protein
MNASAADGLDSRWESFCPMYTDITGSVPDEKKPEVCAKIKEFYIGEEPISSKNVEPLTKVRLIMFCVLGVFYF